MPLPLAAFRVRLVGNDNKHSWHKSAHPSHCAAISSDMTINTLYLPLFRIYCPIHCHTSHFASKYSTMISFQRTPRHLAIWTRYTPSVASIWGKRIGQSRLPCTSVTTSNTALVRDKVEHLGTSENTTTMSAKTLASHFVPWVAMGDTIGTSLQFYKWGEWYLQMNHTQSVE